MDFTVIWNGTHNNRGEDALLPPREEKTNPLWVAPKDLIERIHFPSTSPDRFRELLRRSIIIDEGARYEAKQLSRMSARAFRRRLCTPAGCRPSALVRRGPGRY